jgi:hypothetical protein
VRSLRASGRCFTAFVIIASAALSGPSEGLGVELDILNPRRLVGEPLRFAISYKNETGQLVRVEDRGIVLQILDAEGKQVEMNTGIIAFDTGCPYPAPEAIEVPGVRREVVIENGKELYRAYMVGGYMPIGHYRIKATVPRKKECSRSPWTKKDAPVSEEAYLGDLESKETTFKILEPHGVDAKVWELMKERFERGAQWAFAGGGTIGEGKAKQIVTLYPESRYAPYALFYTLMGFETFIGKYPDHLLAPLAYHHRIEHLVRQGRLSALVERDTKRHAIREVQKLVAALREKYPDTDAAWYAGYMEKWLSLLDRYQAEGPTMALHGEVEKFVGDAPSSWVKKEAEILARDIPMILEERGERKREVEQPKAPEEKQPE